MGRLANEKSKCKNNKMTGNTIYLSKLIILIINGANSTIKRHKMAGWIIK
jgi:hypothetical protein